MSSNETIEFMMGERLRTPVEVDGETWIVSTAPVPRYGGGVSGGPLVREGWETAIVSPDGDVEQLEWSETWDAAQGDHASVLARVRAGEVSP